MINKDNKKPSKIQERKVLLIEMSITAKKIREQKSNSAKTAEDILFWSSRTVNYMLLNFVYNQGESPVYNTFNEWKRQGATVRKGSKATVIWGQPLKGSKGAEGATPENTAKRASETVSDDMSQYEFFPLCFLFSEKDIYFTDTTKQESEPTNNDNSSINMVEFDNSIMNDL